MNVLFIGQTLSLHSAYRVRFLSSLENIWRELGHTHRKFSILSLEPPRSILRESDKLKGRRINREIKTSIGNLPIVHLFPNLINLPYVILDIIRICSKGKMDIIHAHGPRACFLMIVANVFLKRKILFDMHGVWADEFVMIGKYTNDSIQFKRDKFLENFCIVNSDFVITASQALQNYVRNIRNRRKENTANVPCCVNLNFFYYCKNTRSEMRYKYGLSDKFVVLYMGSFQPWQMRDEMIEIFMKIRKGRNAHFLILTLQDSKDVKNSLSSMNVSEADYTILGSSHEEIAKYIMMGDLAFLIRAKSPVNKFAFPTKFAEYLSCGVPVLCTSAVEDISQITKTYKVGTVIDDIDNDYSIESGIENFFSLINENQKLRQWCSYIAKKLLSWEKGSKIYVDAYRKMCNMTVKSF